MGDPYLQCRDDIVKLLSNAEEMLEVLISIRENDVNYGKQRRDLKRIIAEIEEYMEDVSTSVDLAQRNMTAFGISEDEMENRRDFVRESEGRLRYLKERLPEQPKQRQQPQGSGGDGGNTTEYPPTPEGDSEIQGLLLEQTDARQRQEAELEQLGHAVGRIKEMGVTIETEIKEQDALLDKLSNGVVSVTEKLKHTSKKIDTVIDEVCYYYFIPTPNFPNFIK